MNIKLEDVARRLGVSKATVSLALNGSPRVNERTRERVLAVSREMGYHPNPYARRLVTQKSRLIGLIVPDIENVYYASLVRHVSDALNRAGYALNVATSTNSHLTERKIIGEMLESRVDALLLAPVNAPAGSTAYLSAADDAGVPLLFFTSIYADLARPCVMCDLYGGMKALMTRLYESGRRRIALLTGPRDVYCLDLRERGWRDFLVEHALPADAALHLSEVSYEAALTALRDYPLQNIDAAVCVNDMMALGAVNALLARGVRVPEDVAVAGYDDVIFSRVSPVPITTVRQDVHALAAAAVDRLLDMIEHRDPVKAVTLLPTDRARINRRGRAVTRQNGGKTHAPAIFGGIAGGAAKNRASLETANDYAPPCAALDNLAQKVTYN